MGRHRRSGSHFGQDDPRLETAGFWVTVAWVFGGAVYFYGHFSLLFIQENRSGIEAILERARDFLTFG